MTNDPYRAIPEEDISPHMAIRLLGVTLCAVFLRVLDGVVFLRWPRLWWRLTLVGIRGLTQSPYRVGTYRRTSLARAFGKSLAELTYGETPCVTAFWLLKQAGVNRDARLIDLGAGRGRVLFAGRALGAEASGIELLSEHVEAIQGVVAPVGIHLRHADAVDVSLGAYTHVYCAWTCFSEHTRAKLAARFAELPPRARVITLQWPVVADGFHVVKSGQVLCSWGVTPYYISMREPSADGRGCPDS